MVSSPSHLSFPHIQTCSPPVPVPYFVKQMSIKSEVTICLVRNWVTSSLHHSFFNDLTLADMDSYSKADAVVKVFKVGDVLLSLLILRLKVRTAPPPLLHLTWHDNNLLSGSKLHGRWFWQSKEKATILSGAEFYMEAFSFRNWKNAAHSEHHCILLLSEKKFFSSWIFISPW